MKMTIKERVEAMALENLTQEDFDFLVERALKSIRPAHKSDKPSKAQIERQNELMGVYQFVKDMGRPVTCAEVQANFGWATPQKASRALNDCEGLVKIPAQGKRKVSWMDANDYFAQRENVE